MHLEQQRSLQHEAYGIDYAAMDNNERIKHFKDMSLALTDEIHEALNEMGWKPWATSRHFSTGAVQDELIDAYHFLMNLMLIADMDEELVNQLYMEKNRKNLQRQVDGYDGVSTKCPNCKRALDDDNVRCEVFIDGSVYCQVTNEAWNSIEEVNR